MSLVSPTPREGVSRQRADHRRRTARVGRRCHIGLAAMAWLAAGAALAVPVVPGGGVFVPGTTLTDRPDLSGPDLYSDASEVRVVHPSPLGGGGLFAGWLVRQQVLRSDTTGALVFSTQLVWDRNITFGNFLVDALWLDGWGDAATDVDYRTDLSGDRGPSLAARSADGQRLELGFGFPLFSGNQVGEPQENSMPILVATDAQAFATTGALTVVGRFSDRPPGEVYFGRMEGLLVPVAAPVPEPAGWVMMGLGGIALALLRRR